MFSLKITFMILATLATEPTPFGEATSMNTFPDRASCEAVMDLAARNAGKVVDAAVKATGQGVLYSAVPRCEAIGQPI